MCHKAFSLMLGPQTNFIIGSNGSGKSAVLTGISVALGAKATDTDRGSSLKNLIMHGKNVARAIVTLKNEGPEAYKPAEFGPRIIIERTLKMEGAHTLKIKNSENKVISTTRNTVDAILEYFGITIANPMTILTQTEAKTFLAHSTDKDKFNSFMSGTRLKESFDNIKNIESNTNEIKDILTQNKTVHEEMKIKFKEARKVWNSFKDSDEYSKKKELLIGKKIWVEYKENEKLYLKASELLDKKKAEISENETKKSSITEDIVTMEKAKEELENGLLENYKEKYIRCKEEKDNSKNLITHAKEEIDEINSKLSNIKGNIDESKKLVTKIDKDIELEKKKVESSSEENVERLKSFQDKQKEKLADLNKQKEEMSSNMEDLQKNLSNIKQQSREISQSIEKTNDKLESLAVGTFRLESLIEEKENTEANLSLEVQRLEPIQAELHKAQKGMETQIEIYRSISEDYNNSRKVYEKKLKELSGFDSNIQFGKGNIRTLDSTNVKLESDVAKLNDYLTKTSDVMRTLETQANEFCSLEEAQLRPGVSTKSIDEEISGINRYLEEIENRQGITKELAELNLIKANSELKEIETKFSDTIGLYNKLCAALENRLNNLLQTTYLTFQEVESVFISALRIRRFRGKIEFNVKKGTLTLKVATKETAPLRSVESFSGGEKSYGQIAFLFAIWGPMHSRVRGLDEFDVFMDNINRRIALKLILSKVAENPKRQTIFITPLGVANVEGLDKKTVNIHEISPPERANA
ncbi:hypothetical protein PICMEDRAFT_32072 [Pichia membranifaciens NRRL Y-2026]|uniref:RecF/RecN/SMC N-terminal domain-containing protein n=1 Tax=Pichia membranifaciens NRRL Y-2026 TaxID=763406 RepID=A0A1E3NNF5_9ASCO|nr:hypothetical protein PICMEDRAFT_32072 [Pichia membranifaciens NRRL Y-2026]ODQ47637.1 hypothetical protein PICMEDRAFT_32072 [Pichia membranifaciens NRRL Y-2026]